MLFPFRRMLAGTARTLSSALVATFLALGTRAEIVESVESDGYGNTEQEAEYDAVARAVMRVTGVNVVETEVWKTTVVETSESNDGDASAKLRFVDGLNKDRIFRSKGRVKGWSLDSVTFIEARRRFKAHVSVDVAKYSAPDGRPNDQRRIIILPFETRPGSFKIVARRFNLKEVSQKLAEKLNDYFTQTRRFAVLDRRYDRDVDDELLRLEGRNASDDDRVQLGNKLATDYMVVGDMRIMDKRGGIGDLAEQQKDYAMLVLHYRVILCATAQVKWSDTISIPASAAIGETEEECLENLLDEGARILHMAVIENLYPIKLADVVTDDQKNVPLFILNRGGRGVKVGDTFSLMKLGREILDPDSGEVLERHETFIGKVVIVKVSNKTSHAVLVDGSPMPSVKREDLGSVILRRGAPGGPGPSVRGKTAESPSRPASGTRLADLRLAQYSELEKTLYKMRTGNFSGETLSTLYKMRKEAPNAEIKGLVEKVVGVGLVSLGDFNGYNRIKKNIEGASALEAKMREHCVQCQGSGEGTVTCTECGGRGKCRNCNGVGSRLRTPRGSFTSIRVPCNMCSAENLNSGRASSGKCVRCDGTGKVAGKCRRCAGSGMVASTSAAEKLVLRLIQTALDEFAVSRGEEREVRSADEPDAPSEDDSVEDDAEDGGFGGAPERRRQRRRSNRQSEDSESDPTGFGG